MKPRHAVIVVLILFLFLLVPFTMAAKVTQSLESVGLDIRIPRAEYIKQYLDGDLYVHVYNSTDGLLVTNKTTSCNLHLYNNTGEHTYHADFNWSLEYNEFEIHLEPANFSRIGFYSFIIQCNSSDVGGFVSDSFMVNVNGEAIDSDTTGGIAIVIFILFISLMLFALPFIKETFIKNQIANLIIKRLCWVVFLYLMMLNSAIVSTIAYNSGLELTSEMFRYMWLFGTLGWLFMGFTVLKTLFDVMKLWKKNIANKRTGLYDDDDDGMGTGEEDK